MISLIGQTLAVAAGALLVRAILARAGVDLGLPRAAALAALLLLGILSVASLRESWHALDLQRAHNSRVSSVSAGADCLKVGIDARALGWVASRIPDRERFYFRAGRPLPPNGDLCVRFALLPRIQVRRPSQARFVVFWRGTPASAIAGLRRRGALVERFRRDYAVARLP